MHTRRFAHFVLALLVTFMAFAALPCRAADAPQIRAVITIPPLQWPLRQLISDKQVGLTAKITLLVAPGASEHGFELTPSQLAEINAADLVLMAGNGLEPTVVSALNRKSRSGRQVVSFEGLGDAIPHDHDHDHDADHEHASSADPHLWLDPVVMGQYVQKVAAALREFIEREEIPTEQKKARISALENRAQQVAAECTKIDQEYRLRLQAVPGRTIVTHHNAYAYLCRRYGLKVAAVIRPFDTAEPTPAEVDAALKAIRDQHVTAIFIEPQFPEGIAKRIADVGKVKTLTLDPLGDGDWPATMRKNLDALVEGLKQ